MKIFVYIAECSDGSYYTGVTNDVERRIAEHNSGEDNDSYTSFRRPVVLKFVQEFDEPYQAISAEKQIKGWSRAKKEALIEGKFDELVLLSKKYKV